MREELMAKARRIMEADRSRRIKDIEKFIESRRSSGRLYSPEKGKGLLRDLFGDKRRKATIEK